MATCGRLGLSQILRLITTFGEYVSGQEMQWWDRLPHFGGFIEIVAFHKVSDVVGTRDSYLEIVLRCILKIGAHLGWRRFSGSSNYLAQPHAHKCEGL